jgi:hypothetical protein
MHQLTIAAYRTHATRGTQITLSQTDENGRGWGRRLAGPKHYNSGTTELVSAVLDEGDAREIRRMLDAVFPTGGQTVYRADYESMTLGLYTSREEARAHCLGEAALSGLVLDGPGWVPDDGDPMSPEELCHTTEVVCTGYTVTPLTAAAKYDPNAGG